MLKWQSVCNHWSLVVFVALLGTFELYLCDLVRECIGEAVEAELRLSISGQGRSGAAGVAIEWILRDALAWRFISLILFEALTCLLGGLDYIHCVGVCIAGILSLATAEAYVATALSLSLTSDKAAQEALLSALVAAPMATTLILYGARRINRHERDSFLQLYTSHNKVDEERKMFQGKRTQLLALFSNPKVPDNLKKLFALQNLHFAKELKTLFRSIDPVFVSILPAATMDDVERELRKASPRIIMFSGHTLLGTLAFESDGGNVIESPVMISGGSDVLTKEARRFSAQHSIDSLHRTAYKNGHDFLRLLAADEANVSAVRSSLRAAGPPPAITQTSGNSSFISLRKAPSASHGPDPDASGDNNDARVPVECVFLNACESDKYGHELLARTNNKDVCVICWSTLTEHNAASAFAQGFYDSIGEKLSHAHRSSLRLPIEKAFVAACHRFKQEGFVFGDPQAFLDSPCQSVTGRPDYAHCPHCQPPVHGVVLLLARSSDGGEVKAVDGRNAGRLLRSMPKSHPRRPVRRSNLSSLLLLTSGGAASDEPRGRHELRVMKLYLQAALMLVILLAASTLAFGMLLLYGDQ